MSSCIVEEALQEQKRYEDMYNEAVEARISVLEALTKGSNAQALELMFEVDTKMMLIRRYHKSLIVTLAKWCIKSMDEVKELKAQKEGAE